jgi:hypothetical protein
VSRFQFVADHRHAYGVKRLCEVLQIARSSFYAWLQAQPRRAARAGADAELANRIPVVHERDRAASAPPCPSRPIRRCPICCDATSPRTRRTSATSGTSPICRWRKSVGVAIQDAAAAAVVLNRLGGQ